VLLSIQWETVLYLELILIFSLLGFLTTVAFVIYLNKTSQTLRAAGEISGRPTPPKP